MIMVITLSKFTIMSIIHIMVIIAINIVELAIRIVQRAFNVIIIKLDLAIKFMNIIMTIIRFLRCTESD